MLAKELSVAGRKDVGGGRRGSDHVLEAVYAPTFHVNTVKHGSRNAALALLEQSVSLNRGRDVARKQDGAGRLQAGKQVAELRGHLGTVEADDQKLSDLGSKILRGFLQHAGVKVSLPVSSAPREGSGPRAG